MSGISAPHRSTTSIIIEWAAPAIDGGCTISSYVVPSARIWRHVEVHATRVRFDGVDQPEQSQTVFATAAGAVTTGPTYDFEVADVINERLDAHARARTHARTHT
eukprot:1798555-Amphidinium_carterae.1